MKERPILFSASMVRAILDGSKTQTRRVMQTQPYEGWTPFSYGDLHGYDKHGDLSPDKVIGWGPVNEDGEYGYKSRLGQPGDRLWVRETWSADCPEVAYRADMTSRYFKKSDPLYPELLRLYDRQRGDWAPSIFMPRWASRITLEITAVRVERLQDISYEDALAEGVADARPLLGNTEPSHGETADETSRRLRWPQREYELLWNKINGVGAWNKNPWVWVIEFKRVPQ